MRIFHIMVYDKFTEGYIDFFQCHFSQYAHKFLIIGKPLKLDCLNNDNIYFVNYVLGIFRFKKDLYESDKIIISGLFQIQFPYVLFKKSVLNKTYIQFWGGDYTKYSLDRKSSTWIEKAFSSYLIERCAGVINLIEEEYDEFSTVFPKHNKHFVAPMPISLRKIPDYSKYVIAPYDKSELNIMVGNSATQTNHHQEIFECLKKLEFSDFHVYCPLSYGDLQYAEKVKEQGKGYFGNRFHSLSRYMSSEEYLEFLSQMDIGIFNVTRQQAMGNINRMLYIGKKVYINKGCVLWEKYLKQGYILHAIEEIKCFPSLSRISDDEFHHNVAIYSPNNSVQCSIDLWTIVFND